MRKLFFGVIFFLNVHASLAQNEDSVFIRRISNETLTHSEAYNNLHELTKNIGPRLSGSSQMVKAEQWGLKKMNAAGADKGWMQQCMVPHWVRGGTDKAEARIQKAGGSKSSFSPPRPLDVIALGNSIGTGPKGVSAPVMEVKSFEELRERKEEVKGKIVFYNYKFNPTFISTFNAYGDAYRYRGDGPSEASKYGAVAVIVRSMTHSTDNNPHTGATLYDSTYPLIAAVAIGLKDADWLSNSLSGKVNVMIKTNGHFLPDTIGHNIIGELTGSEYPNQYITVGGHLDSWDPGEGAQDDGAGVVQTMEILRTLKALGYRPRHSLRFVLFANEENGSRGGEKYAEEAKTKNEQHIFALESDAGGFTPRGFSFSGSPQQLAKLRSWIPLLLPYGVYEITDGGGGSDIGPLNVAFKTPVAGLSPDTQRYFDYHHARNDVFENVNKRELELGAINMAALIYLVDKYGL